MSAEPDDTAAAEAKRLAHDTVLQSIRDLTTQIAALDKAATTKKAEREDLYEQGVELGIPKVRLGEAAGVTGEAVWHAVRKRRDVREAAQVLGD